MSTLASTRGKQICLTACETTFRGRRNPLQFVPQAVGQTSWHRKPLDMHSPMTALPNVSPQQSRITDATFELPANADLEQRLHQALRDARERLARRDVLLGGGE